MTTRSAYVSLPSYEDGRVDALTLVPLAWAFWGGQWELANLDLHWGRS